jgi:hypothetical protein
LKMIGARQVAGSTISNGGDSSPSNWVIVGRRPLNVRFAFFPSAESMMQPIMPKGRAL